MFLCSERKDKPMHRIFLLIMILLVFFALAVPAFAEEVGEAPALEVTTAAAPGESEPSEESPSEEISGILKEWVPEILSAAALAVAMVIAYLFKKGLLPTVTRLLTSIVETVTNSHDKVTEETSAILECMNGFTYRMTELEKRLSSREDKLYSEAELISESLTDMSDTLTDIFEHTNLPAEVKAMIAAKHKEHTEKIRRILATVTGGDPDEE